MKVKVEVGSWWRNKANGETAEVVVVRRGSATIRRAGESLRTWISLEMLYCSWEPAIGIPTREEAAGLFKEAARYCKAQPWAVRDSFDVLNGECSADAIPWLSKRLRDNFAVGLKYLVVAPHVMEGYLLAAAFEMSLSDPF